MKNLSGPDDKRFSRQLKWDAVKILLLIGLSWFVVLLVGIKIFLS